MADSMTTRINYPKYIPKTHFHLLSSNEVAQRWEEENTNPGVRFGGVAMIRLHNRHDLGYGFVAGNDITAEYCPLHKTVMGLEKIKNDTNHNIENAFFYHCEMVHVEGDRNVRCPVFPEYLLLQIMANSNSANLAKIVWLQ